MSKGLKIHAPSALTELIDRINEQRQDEQNDAADMKNSKPNRSGTVKKSGIFSKLRNGFRSESRHENMTINQTANHSLISSSTSKTSRLMKLDTVNQKLEEYNTILNNPDKSKKLSGLWKVLKDKISANEEFKEVIIYIIGRSKLC